MWFLDHSCTNVILSNCCATIFRQLPLNPLLSNMWSNSGFYGPIVAQQYFENCLSTRCCAICGLTMGFQVQLLRTDNPLSCRLSTPVVKTQHTYINGPIRCRYWFSSVSIVSGYGLDDRVSRFDPRQRWKDFSSSLCVQTSCRSNIH
jgi:hypothetical protein